MTDAYGNIVEEQPANSSRTIEDCANICNAYDGCNSFQFGVRSEATGRCKIFTNNENNIGTDNNRISEASHWRSCVKEDCGDCIRKVKVERLCHCFDGDESCPSIIECLDGCAYEMELSCYQGTATCFNTYAGSGNCEADNSNFVVIHRFLYNFFENIRSRF